MNIPKNKFLLAVVLFSPLFAVLAFRAKEAVPPKRAPGADSPASARLAALPRLILWAWERPEQLDFIDPKRIGVAFLAKTVYLRGADVVARPRLQPLHVPDGTNLIAVARLESDWHDRPQLTVAQIEMTAKEVAGLARLPNVSAVQIDFDATLSERPFYRALLNAVREKLPPAIPLSITALASWCEGDDWLSDLPIDEAVPMLFRLGVERRQFAVRVKTDAGLRALPCRSAAGVSTDEPIALLPVPRLYIFNPTSWSPKSFDAAMEAYDR